MSRKYFKINKRYVIVSTLGLVLATIMISQTMLTNSSYQQNSLENYLANENSIGFRIQLNNEAIQFQNQIDINDQINTIEGVVVSKLEDSSLSFDYGVTTLNTFVELAISPIVTEEDDSRNIRTQGFNMYAWNDALASVLEGLPTFNGKPDQNSSLLILNQWMTIEDAPNLYESSISLTVGNTWKNSDDTSPFNLLNYTVDRHWVPTENDRNKAYEKNDGSKSQIVQDSFIVSETKYFQIIQDIKTISESNNLDYYWWNSVEYDVHVKFPDITSNSVDKIIFELDQMANSLRSTLGSLSTIQNVWLDSPLAYTLENYKSQQEGFAVALTMISLPLIGVSLFLVYFSLTLVEKRKSKIIAIMKIRGSSRDQLRLMQFSEVLVAGTVAAAAGMLLSIPWALLTFRVSDFFQFDADPIGLTIPSSWYWRLPQIAIILTIDLNINSLLTLSDTRIDEGEDAEESKAPFWQRIYLDLILFSLSTGVLIFIRRFPVGDDGLFGFLLSIAPLFLLTLLITSPLVVSRYFSTIISFISDFLWKVQGGMLALATRNMRKNKFSSSRLTALLMLGMMLSFVSIIIPTSLVSYEIERANYEVGADVLISNIDINNQTLLKLTEVEGVQSRTEIVRAGIDLYRSIDSDPTVIYRGNIGYYDFLGVNTTTFSETAYWRDNYADPGLGSILSKINNGTVGTSSKQLSALGIKVGDNIPNLPTNVSDVQAIVTFDYFPNLITYEPIDYGDYVDAWRVEFLGDIEFVTSLKSKSQFYSTGVYLKLEDGVNKTLVDELLYNNFADYSEIKIRSVNQDFNSIQDADEFKIILSSFQSMLIITIFISIIAVSYFAFITLSERNKEIGTFRAIGMVKNQIFVLLIVEAMIMLVSGIIFGAIMGWFISSNLFFILNSDSVGGIIPPQTLYIPWRLTMGFLATMFISTGIAAGFPAQRVASKQTGNILRAE